MKVLGFRRRPIEDGFVRQVGLEECLRESLFLAVLLPLTPETRGMIGRRELQKMRPGSFLLHLGRGGVVDEEALCEALEAGHLGGAALDVFSREPPGEDPVFLRLRRLPHVLFTPHLAGLTRESQRRMGYLLGCDLLRVLRGLPPRREARLSP
jgi:D-3-phosphoglycerate dehydrogenase